MSSNQFNSAETLQQPYSQAEYPNSSLPYDPVLLGDSLAIRRLRSQIQRIAPYFHTALLRGETGSGKQLVARAIHALSPGADGPFIVANASALAQSAADSETSHSTTSLFATSMLESVQGGTLYLECVGDLPFALQTALFRFIRTCLERRDNHRPSGCNLRHRSNPLRLDTRILASTDRDLRVLAAVGQFRQDLYTSFSAVEILVPSLRQRVEDIPHLVDWLMHRIAADSGQGPKLLDKATLAQLQKRLWPNNLRDLERVVTQAAALAGGACVEPRHLLALVDPPATTPPRSPAIHIERLHDVIQQHVLDVLTRCGGNKLRAAQLLGISRSTLYRMLDAGTTSTEKNL